METKIYLSELDISITTMMEFNAKVKKWGNSFGVVIPKDELEKNNLKEGEEIYIIGKKKSKSLRNIFGIMPNLPSGQEVKDELRRELYDD